MALARFNYKDAAITSGYFFVIATEIGPIQNIPSF